MINGFILIVGQAFDWFSQKRVVFIELMNDHNPCYITFKVKMKCKEYGITFQVAYFLHTKIQLQMKLSPSFLWHFKSSK